MRETYCRIYENTHIHSQQCSFSVEETRIEEILSVKIINLLGYSCSQSAMSIFSERNLKKSWDTGTTGVLDYLQALVNAKSSEKASIAQ